MVLQHGKGCPNAFHRIAIFWISLASLLALSASVRAERSEIFDEKSHLYIQTSLYTEHFKPKPEHNNEQRLVDLQLHWKSKYFVGYSFFSNSFSQPTHYFYVGHEWDIPNTNDMLYASLTGGFAHGYDGDKKDQIPLNSSGTAPIILPMVGVRYNHIHSQIILFGTSGYTLTAGVDFPL